jgi:hypothetical protein
MNSAWPLCADCTRMFAFPFVFVSAISAGPVRGSRRVHDETTARRRSDAPVRPKTLKRKERKTGVAREPVTGLRAEVSRGASAQHEVDPGEQVADRGSRLDATPGGRRSNRRRRFPHSRKTWRGDAGGLRALARPPGSQARDPGSLQLCFLPSRLPATSWSLASSPKLDPRGTVAGRSSRRVKQWTPRPLNSTSSSPAQARSV